MSMQILATKLYIPPIQSKLVLRPRLLDRLNEGMYHKLILISAPAGFGKTTLVSEWIDICKRPASWFSMDEGDNDSIRFLTYLVSALQRISVNIGVGVLGLLQSNQSLSIESILTMLLNEITTITDDFTLVLDDYHVIDAKPVEDILAFILDHMPPQMHLIITTRKDPHLSLGRLRVRGQLTELRASDLCFTIEETDLFLSKVMKLNLSAEDIVELDNRTEGWIAGLQLAAISMQWQKDCTNFIKAFNGSHYFVMDYLVEEVLQQQSERVQTFLLKTSILDRMCGSLCDAVSLDSEASGQEILEYLQKANLFIIPLDNERCWYRYHHLFGELLQQRLSKSITVTTKDEKNSLMEYHIRASQWYEDNGLELEAFKHAVYANDIDRATRLIEGKGIPLHFRGALAPVLNWLQSLPTSALDARPSLWIMYASALSMTGQTAIVEQKLLSAEAALKCVESNDGTRNLVGHIAAIRAFIAAMQNKVEEIITQSQLALEYLHPNNLAARTATIWKLGIAYQLKGDRTAAGRAYTEAISISQASGNTIINIVATAGLGSVQETENQLNLAADTYQQVIRLTGDLPQPSTCDAHIGLGRIFYQWNDLNAAEQHGQQSVQMARQIACYDRLVHGEVLLARLKLAHKDLEGAAAILAQAQQLAGQHNLMHLMPEVASVQVLTLLNQGNLESAASLSQKYELPISQVRVYLAQGNTSSAIIELESLRRLAEEKGLVDEQLKVMVLHSVALYVHGENNKAELLLSDTLSLTEPSGLIRIFADEGLPMVRLLSRVATLGIRTDYVGKLLNVFEAEKQKNVEKTGTSPLQTLTEPLSERELEVLQLIAQGLSNHDISGRLFLALDTVKGHNRRIYEKLQVKRRTEAVVRARELGLL